MSFFYDLNKKLDSIRATPEVTHQQLNERDMGKHNNATTGFAALAKKTGGGEKGAKIAGAQLAKMRAKGQVEEDSVAPAAKASASKSSSSKPSDSDYRVVVGKDTGPPPKKPANPLYPDSVPVDEPVDARFRKKPTNEEYTEESAFQAAIGKKKYGEQGMKALQKAGRDHASDSTMNKIRDRYDKYDESVGQADEGNAFSGAVVKAKRDGIQPGEKIHVGGKEYELTEVGVAPGGPGDYNYIKNNYQNVTSNGQIIGTTADGGKTFISSRPVEFNSGSMPQGATVVQPGKKINVGGVKEAAKYRDPKYKDKLYTQEPPDYTYGPDMDDAYYNPKPDDYAGRKRPMGGSGGDPLTKGFRKSADKSINTQGKRKGLPSRDQITSLKGSIKDVQGTHTPAKFADKVGRAKKEVDEMLGDVAAEAMRSALSPKQQKLDKNQNGKLDANDFAMLRKGAKQGRNAEMDEGFMDDEPTSRRSSSGGRIDTSQPGRTIHRAVKGNYSGAGHDAGAEKDSAGSDGPRGRGRPKGSKAAIGAKINRGTSKLMTREGDQDPADQGEYEREGEMSRNEIHTMMRNAKQLEKMLGNDDNLPEWVQKKLSLASDYMQTIADYLASEKETDAEDQTGRRVEVELAEKKAPSKKAKPDFIDADGDGDKTEPMKNAVADKKKKPSAKKEEEVDESTTSGSVATAPTSGKSGGGMSFGKGIYDSINRAVETQITESMNISMNMSTDEHGGPRQTLTITATDEDASQLATLLKMAGMGGGSAESCGTCGMADCGCGDMEQMDETYGDNVVDMNSPNYPTNTEQAENNFGYSGGLNKEKIDVAGNGQSTVPVTAVREQDDEFQESIQRMREIAGIKEAGILTDPRDVMRHVAGPSLVSQLPKPDGGTSANRTSSYKNTFLDPAQKAQQKMARQNESIFTDTANLWKSYKG